MFRPRRGAGFRGLHIAALFYFTGITVHAQFLRIGPFEIGATAKLGGVYTTNIEGARPGSTDKEMKDYYATAGFDLTASSTFSEDFAVDMGTGMSLERHATRKDLDTTTSDPFGRGRIDTELHFGRYTLRLNLASETTLAVTEGTYKPLKSPTERDVNTVTDYGAELDWKRNDWTVVGGFNGSRTRHQDEQFQSGDQNTYGNYLTAGWQFSKRLGLNYAYSRDKTELLNEPMSSSSSDSSPSDWNERNSVGLTFEILERPNFTYTLGAEQSSVQGETIDWESTHTFGLNDDLELTKTLRLSGDVQYKYADKLAADEIALTGSLTLDNEVSRTVHQSLSMNKEPASTFGSTTKTDVTGVNYNLTKQDLFIYNLTFSFGVGFTYNKPMDTPQSDAQDDPLGEPESVWTYDVGLAHDRALSRKLNRTLGYKYSHQKSSLIDGNVVEHRVTLDFTYTF